ncbi:TetR/AcrR family transcriptional regulator [Planomonospora sp. ID67723]|nr:TetR/AcrR family transcriptional regulator [Planomonospora sp. ID67723]
MERRRESPARARILDTATRLFYAEGVHTVGIDRIIAEAGVAKATFYHHFPAKDELVRAYLEAEHRRQRAAAETVRAVSAGPREMLLAIFDYLGDNGAAPLFRGCPFTNAAAEYPDPAHPVRRAVADYRRWNRELFRDLLAGAGHPDPERTATILMVIRDGIVVGSDLDDPDVLRPLIRDAVTRVLDAPVPRA